MPNKNIHVTYEEVAQYFLNARSSRRTAAHFGISHSSVCRYIKSSGIDEAIALLERNRKRP